VAVRSRKAEGRRQEAEGGKKDGREGDGETDGWGD